jgi:hypothetical protein
VCTSGRGSVSPISSFLCCKTDNVYFPGMLCELLKADMMFSSASSGSLLECILMVTVPSLLCSVLPHAHPEVTGDRSSQFIPHVLLYSPRCPSEPLFQGHPSFALRYSLKTAFLPWGRHFFLCQESCSSCLVPLGY